MKITELFVLRVVIIILEYEDNWFTVCEYATNIINYYYFWIWKGQLSQK